MDVLEFIYTKRLQASTIWPLLIILRVADKYEVTACLRQCSRLLQSLPMKPELALLFLKLPLNFLHRNMM